MKGTMKAARIHALGEPLRVEEVPIPDIGKGEVLIRVLRAGLNRGDQHMRAGEIRVSAGEEVKFVAAYLPMIIGHDGLGEVAEVGPDVHGVHVGDRVVTVPQLSCGACRYCRNGRVHLCVHHRVMGFVTFHKEEMFSRYKDGLWAEYCRVPATSIVRLERDDSVDRFCRVSQMAVGYRTLKRTRLESGETVIVNGATGITGVGVVLSALAMGAAQVIAIARDPARLAHLQKVDPRRLATVSIPGESIQKRVMELTRDNGANILVDVNPNGGESLLECLYSLERGGRAGLIAGHSQSLQLPYTFFLIRNIEFTSWHGRAVEDVEHLIELTRRGVIDVSYIRPTFFKLAEINEALDALQNRSAGDVPVWPMMRAD